MIISTFYDGSQFGELSNFQSQADVLSPEMIKELQKQKCTCHANEDSYVLVMNKQVINTSQSKADEFQERVRFLQSCALMRQVNLFTLMPIANNLELRTFSLGEVILKAGEVPKGLYFIKKGTCRVGLTVDKLKNEKPIKESWIAHKPEVFSTGKLAKVVMRGDFNNDEDQITSPISGTQSLRQSSEAYECTEAELKMIEGVKSRPHKTKITNLVPRKYTYDENFIPLPCKKDEEMYRHKLFYKFFTLSERDFFGGRSLLIEIKPSTDSGKAPTAKEEGFEGESNPEQLKNDMKIDPSQLSVVADSVEVEVLIMDRQ